MQQPLPPTNKQNPNQTQTKQKEIQTNLVFLSLFLFTIRNLIMSEWMFTTLSAGFSATFKDQCRVKYYGKTWIWITLLGMTEVFSPSLPSWPSCLAYEFDLS